VAIGIAVPGSQGPNALNLCFMRDKVSADDLRTRYLPRLRQLAAEVADAHRVARAQSM